MFIVQGLHVGPPVQANGIRFPRDHDPQSMYNSNNVDGSKFAIHCLIGTGPGVSIHPTCGARWSRQEGLLLRPSTLRCSLLRSFAIVSLFEYHYCYLTP